MAALQDRSVASEETSLRWTLDSAAGRLLSNCVSVGVVGQEETTALQDAVFSSRLYEAERRMRAERELDQLRLQVELLQQERQSADVAHRFHLARRFQEFQMLNEHLQQVLRNHKRLRERLMKPDAQNNLPLPAHLHRPAVEVVDSMLEFIQNLEDKLSSAHHQASTSEHLRLLGCSVDQLSSLSVQVENLANELLETKSPALHPHHHPHQADDL